MGKNLKYVADFEFPSDCGFSGSSGKTMVKGYARGGAATPAPVKAAVHKHERAMHAGQPPTKLAKGGEVERDIAVRALAGSGAISEKERRALLEAKSKKRSPTIDEVRSVFGSGAISEKERAVLRDTMKGEGYAKGGMAKRPPMPPTQAAAGMARKPAMPMQAKRRSVPVAPAGPMIGMKKGGSAKC
jgi:hypothetical protein